MHETACRILVVDDHADTLNVLARVLRSWGYTVFIAATLSAAKLMFEAEPVDVILSDLSLPDGDGCDLMMWAMGRRRVRGIAMSGHGMGSDLARCKAAGFVEHLLKPCSLTKLRECIEGICTDASPHTRQTLNA
jgi:CheY-like chemotaxis protein